MSRDNQRGSSAVEFAIILPLLLTLVLGIVEFGYIFNQQISLTQAARQGAREFTLHQSVPGFDLTQAVQLAAPTLGPVIATSKTSTVDGLCVVTVTVTKPNKSFTGWFDSILSTKMPTVLTGKGAMRCGG